MLPLPRVLRKPRYTFCSGRGGHINRLACPVLGRQGLRLEPWAYALLNRCATLNCMDYEGSNVLFKEQWTLVSFIMAEHKNSCPIQFLERGTTCDAKTRHDPSSSRKFDQFEWNNVALRKP